MFQNLRRILTLRCDGHLDLVHRRLDQPLGWADRMAAWGHWLACGPCRQTVREIARLETRLRASRLTSTETLSDDARRRIAASIEQTLATHRSDPRGKGST